MSETASTSTEGAERDWVFARRFSIRRMIERGDASAADRIPDIPDVGALQDEIAALRDALEEVTRIVMQEAENHRFGSPGYDMTLDHLHDIASSCREVLAS